MSMIRRGMAARLPHKRIGCAPEICIKRIRTQPPTLATSLEHLFSVNWVIGELTMPFLPLQQALPSTFLNAPALFRSWSGAFSIFLYSILAREFFRVFSNFGFCRTRQFSLYHSIWLFLATSLHHSPFILPRLVPALLTPILLAHFLFNSFISANFPFSLVYFALLHCV